MNSEHLLPNKNRSREARGGDMSVNTRVLVVEDDVANRETLCALLEQMGYAAIPVESGDAALAQLQTSEDFDLIISDVVMPGINGLDFARSVRETRRGIPIVLVTGDSDAMESVLASGAVALLKPYSTETLRQVLAEALEAASP